MMAYSPARFDHAWCMVPGINSKEDVMSPEELFLKLLAAFAFLGIVIMVAWYISGKEVDKTFSRLKTKRK